MDYFNTVFKATINEASWDQYAFFVNDEHKR